MISIWSGRRNAVFSVLALALLSSGALTACSNGSSTKSGGAATPSSSASPSASSTGARSARAGLFTSPAVEQCLSAAGITLPSRAPGAAPSFTGARPSGSPRPSFTGARPSGAAGGFFGGADGAKIQAALKACGITLPTGGARGAAPTTAPAG